jgi:hypothetical protein
MNCGRTGAAIRMPGLCSPGSTMGCIGGPTSGDEEKGWSPVNQELHFHDLRHTHETWLIEEHVPRIMRLVRLGHKRRDVDDIYSHVTDQMIEETLAALQRRWEQDGGWRWASHATQEAAQEEVA